MSIIWTSVLGGYEGHATIRTCGQLVEWLLLCILVVNIGCAFKTLPCPLTFCVFKHNAKIGD